MKPISNYCNGCNKPTTIMKPISNYCNGRKKTKNYYETYMRGLQWL
jgi:hypothetical protein